MKFLHLAAADHGGAGLAAKRLHDGLRSAGHASRMLVLDRRSSDDDIMAFPAAASPFRLRRQAVKAGLKVLARPDYYFQNQRLSPGRVPALADLGSPHVIIVHSISHFISFQDVLDLHKATSAPVIWHLLDMGILTGGCHYAWACRKYESACESCPALRLPSKRDLSARAWAQKRVVAPMIRGVVVAGSSTLARQARASALFASSTVETVLLGVAPEHFYPRDRWAERREFGIVGQGQVIFFGAQRFDQRRSGSLCVSVDRRFRTHDD